MRAWIFQDTKQKQKLGESACPWSVGWNDPDGRKRSKKVGSKSMAEKFRRKKEGELAAGLVAPRQRVKWADFRKQFEAHKLATKRASTVLQYSLALEQFEKHCKPVYVDGVTTSMIDGFISKRLTVDQVEPSTVNKELRHLRHAINKAVAWGMLQTRPALEFQKELQRDPEFVDDATFAKLYESCDKMTRPAAKHYEPAEWWRALITFAYLTGWRIGEILELKRDDLDFEAGTAFVSAEHTKGGRDARIRLPQAVLDQLKMIIGFEPLVFAWPHNERLLWVEFAKLKEAAEVEFSGAFHRFRFGFANANVDSLPEDLLQHLMRHRDRQTTRRYVNQVERMRRAGSASEVHVPAVLLAKKA